MKVLLVAPGHGHSTFDIFHYYYLALKKVGVLVRPFRYERELVLFNRVLKELHGNEDDNEQEAIHLASRALLGEVAIAQPDYVIIVTATTLFWHAHEWLENLRRWINTKIRIGIILTESPYEIDQELKAASWADVVFTNDRAFLPWARRIEPESYYLPRAYSEGVHFPPRADDEPWNDIYFCGSGTGPRIQMFDDAKLHEYDFSLRGDCAFPKEGMEELKSCYVKGIVPNADVANEYRHSKICLNMHRRFCKRVAFEETTDTSYTIRKQIAMMSAEEPWSLNPRSVEIAACGAFQLCDDTRPELVEVFGDSVPTFSDARELSDKVRFYLSHDDLREDLARTAHARVQGRTYTNNAKFLMGKMCA